MSTAPNADSCSASVPDAAGRFGNFGGRYVPETLVHALDLLAADYDAARKDPEFQAELDELAQRMRELL